MNSTRLIFFLLLVPLFLSAQQKNEFRTADSGNWKTLSVWEQYDGSKWVPAHNVPNDSTITVTICKNHVVILSDTAEVKYLTSDYGGKLKVEKSGFLDCAHTIMVYEPIDNLGIIKVR